MSVIRTTQKKKKTKPTSKVAKNAPSFSQTNKLTKRIWKWSTKMLRKKSLQIRKLLRRKVRNRTNVAKAVTIPKKPPRIYLSEAVCYKSRETNSKTIFILFWVSLAKRTWNLPQTKRISSISPTTKKWQDRLTILSIRSYALPIRNR